MSRAGLGAAALALGLVSFVHASPALAVVPSAPHSVVVLRGDASARHWRGRMRLSFANPGPRPLTHVWLRLWDDGIRGCDAPLPVRVTRISGAVAGPPSVNCSALPLELARPVPPGGRGAVRFGLAIDVPLRNDRFGVVGGIALVGNALPVVALSDASGLHLEPYVAFGESFYSATGDYTVTLDAPARVAIAATGVEARTRSVAGGRVEHVFQAPRVRDFAWSAGPLRMRSGRTQTGVRVRVWYGRAVAASAAPRALALAERAMTTYSGWFGAYPYTEVDVVLVPFSRFGGMEYPTLVMSDPRGVAIAHELAHQWWYGLVGDDEYHEPWLDEAFATWSQETFARVVGQNCAGLPWPDDPAARVTTGMDYWATHPQTYFLVVYQHGACALQDLSHLAGPARFRRFLRSYATVHRYGFSTTAAFQQAVERLLPAIDLRRFWAAHKIG